MCLLQRNKRRFGSLCLTLAFTEALPAFAATLTVTNTADSGGGSLRQAIADARPGDTGPQNNGGPTQTVALVSGSPAVDHIPVADCTDANGKRLTTDQRGVARAQGPACDVGAYELVEATPFASSHYDRRNKVTHEIGSPVQSGQQRSVAETWKLSDLPPLRSFNRTAIPQRLSSFDRGLESVVFRKAGTMVIRATFSRSPDSLKDDASPLGGNAA